MSGILFIANSLLKSGAWHHVGCLIPALILNPFILSCLFKQIKPSSDWIITGSISEVVFSTSGNKNKREKTSEIVVAMKEKQPERSLK